MTDFDSFPSGEVWLASLESEFADSESACNAAQLPVVKRNAFEYEIHAFDGEDFRSSLSEVFKDYVATNPLWNTTDEYNQYLLGSSQAMQGVLKAEGAAVTIGSMLAIKGPGAYMVREDENAVLEPLPLLPSEVLFGAVGGVACGPFPDTEGADIEDLVDPARVADMQRVLGGLVNLECVHVCSQTEPNKGRVIRADLVEVYVPVVKTGLSFFAAYPVEQPEA